MGEHLRAAGVIRVLVVAVQVGDTVNEQIYRLTMCRFYLKFRSEKTLLELCNALSLFSKVKIEFRRNRNQECSLNVQTAIPTSIYRTACSNLPKCSQQ